MEPEGYVKGGVSEPEDKTNSEFRMEEVEHHRLHCGGMAIELIDYISCWRDGVCVKCQVQQRYGKPWKQCILGRGM
jgi:hypothetical protein